ncbi:hypothetical protein [Herbaspirillum lusitanum]|uniref:hypothetical protein n=1 Tax=Herbaspirillum lusitanum TaxID=213312 RepID=UPI0012F496E2|nr:hypothetical protein [Herbaspirillum lusitanum]
MNVSTNTAAYATKQTDYTAASTPKATSVNDTTSSTPPSTGNPVKTDTVTISNAARVALAEATETAAQTTKEAQGGDRQAMKVLAKQQHSHTKQSAVPA